MRVALLRFGLCRKCLTVREIRYLMSVLRFGLLLDIKRLYILEIDVKHTTCSPLYSSSHWPRGQAGEVVGILRVEQK